MIFPELSDTGPLIAVLVRAVVPLSMLKWPLGGLAASILADAMDVVIVGLVQDGTYANYTATDKFFDTYSLAISASIALSWTNRAARTTALALFYMRVIGVAVVAITGFGSIFFFFPNIFELFYAYHLVTVKWFPSGELGSSRSIIGIVVLISAMKLVQEYILHICPILYPYAYQAVILTLVFCLPTGLASFVYLTLHHFESVPQWGLRVKDAGLRAKNFGWVTAGVGLFFFAFWTGLAGLNIVIAYSGGV